MPLELLHKISQSSLPATLKEVEDIDKLRVLRAAGLVVAMLPGVNSRKPLARVLAITQAGHKALSHFDAAFAEERGPSPPGAGFLTSARQASTVR